MRVATFDVLISGSMSSRAARRLTNVVLPCRRVLGSTARAWSKELFWLAIALLSGGPGLLVSDYLSFLNATAEKPTTWTYYAIGLGMTLLGVGAASRVRTTGFAAFAQMGEKKDTLTPKGCPK